ncbi:MAG: tRNA lysidine(34) synthetase TilS [Candidatus Babeliales bacterium]
MKTFFDSCIQKASSLIESASIEGHGRMILRYNLLRKSLRMSGVNKPARGECAPHARIEPSPEWWRAKTQKRKISDTTTIIVGLSGGPDSVFLLHVLNHLQKQNQQIKIIATHLDHQWRAESWRDVEFCSNLCKSLGIEFIARKANKLNLDIKFNGSKEEIGRKMRRTLFKQILKEKNADFIALAHHLQDQQETFFIRLLRGASLSGLCCMKEIDGNYIRPLLGINKKDILEYLDASRNREARSNQIKYLIDPTNVSPDYLRNRIRSNVIPALEQCDERFNKKFQSTLEQLNLEDDFLKTLATQAFNDIFEQPKNLNTDLTNSNHWLGDLKKFKLLHPVLARRVILHWLIQEKLAFNLSTNYLDEIIKFLISPRGGTHLVGQKWKIYKKANSFGISLFEIKS